MIRKILEFFGLKRLSANRRVRVKVIRRRRAPTPQPAPPPQFNNAPIDYLLNDMTTPDMAKKINPPGAVHPPIIVKNYQGGGFGRDTEQAQAANCYVTIENTLRFLSQHTDQPLIKWVGTSCLAVIPRAGTDINACYDRRSLRFFHFAHPQIGGSIYTADSAEVVAHELGHAIFDSYRPETWNAACLEVWSYHETIADFIAMLNLMSFDEVLEHTLRQTGGNLRMPSIISNIAEHVGRAIHQLTGDSNRSPDNLRSAINNFVYVDPGTLPKEAPHNQLAAEVHSFGRIFLGALYDVMVMIYEDAAQGMSQIEALRHARDVMAKYVLKAMHNAPVNVHFYESMAKTLLWADVTLSNRKYHDRMRQIFWARNLMKPQVQLLSAPTCDNSDLIIKAQSTINLRLSDHMLRAQNQQDNSLYEAELEIPNGQAYLYDNNGHILDIVGAVSDTAYLGAAQDMVIYLHQLGKVSSSPETPFEVVEGKLVRTHFDGGL